MHAACRYCSPADHLAKLGFQKASSQSIQSVVALSTASAASLPSAAGMCLQTATTPPSLAQHKPCAHQLLGHGSAQREQSDVTANPEGQQLASSGSTLAALQLVGDVVHQPSVAQSLKRKAVDDATEQLVVAAAAREQRHLCSTTEHAEAGTHLSKVYKCVSPRQLSAVACEKIGANGEDPFQLFFCKNVLCQLPNHCCPDMSRAWCCLKGLRKSAAVAMLPSSRVPWQCMPPNRHKVMLVTVMWPCWYTSSASKQ